MNLLEHEPPERKIQICIIRTVSIFPASKVQLLSLLVGNRILAKMVFCPMLAGPSCVDVTPTYLWSNQLQVILLYPLADPEIFWSRNLCLSPWPNTTSSGRPRRPEAGPALCVSGSVPTLDPRNPHSYLFRYRYLVKQESCSTELWNVFPHLLLIWWNRLFIDCRYSLYTTPGSLCRIWT